MSDKLYPLRFSPIYQQKMWGGTLLNEILKRNVPPGTGESWELSDRDDAQSIVENGPLKGTALNELVKRYGAALLGTYGGESPEKFPLLIKLIDAGERLSLQVHPDAAACIEIGNGAEPKTEMWYVVACRPGADIMAGLSRRSTRQMLENKLTSPEIAAMLQNYDSHPGDAYFINAGMPHAIGAGNLILEIQQNSDTTYRLSDWGRIDAKTGKMRELHIEQGMASIDFQGRPSPKITGVCGRSSHNRKFDVVTNCPFFKVEDLRIMERWNDETTKNSFQYLTAINRPIKVFLSDDPVNEYLLSPGESLFLPACCGAYCIEPISTEGECTIVRTTLA